MRMQTCPHTGELRNALAQDWITFFQQAIPEACLIPILNQGESVCSHVTQLGLDGLILSGGDDWGTFLIRDKTEKTLCNWAVQNNIPLIGVCRGMQVINFCLGGKHPSITDRSHIAVHHIINFCDGQSLPAKVNSYHGNLLYPEDISPLMYIVATAEDGSIEAISNDQKNICGIMWHPEREAMPQENDIKLFHEIFRMKQ